MRIESYTKVQQVYNSQNMKRAAGAGTAASSKDQLQISSIGKDIQTAKAALSATPDIREDLTASIKAKVQSGEYQVSTEDLAEKLLEKFSALV